MGVHLGFEVADILSSNRVKNEEIESIRIWANENGYDLITDQQIIQFIIACSQDLELTKNTIMKYYKIRHESKDIFFDRNVQDLQNVISISCLGVIPKRTEGDCVVAFYKLVDDDYRKFDSGSTYKLFCMLLDTAVYKYPANGIIFIIDLEKMVPMHLCKMGLGVLARVLRYLQEALPAKLKAIHVLNTFYVVEKFLSMIKPFMNKNLSNLIFMHSKPLKIDEFFEKYLQKDCVPEDYGGTSLHSSKIHNTFLSQLSDMKNFFDEEQEQRDLIINKLEKQ